MKKLFIVSVDDATRAQRDAFTVALQEKKSGLGFWHHVQTTWIIIDLGGAMNVNDLSDEVRSHMPKATVMVLDVKPLNYMFFAPAESHEWLDALDPKEWP